LKCYQTILVRKITFDRCNVKYYRYNMTSKINDVGSRLREFAEHKGGVEALSKLIEMQSSNLGKYLRGDVLPGSTLLSRLIALGCNLNWLFTGEGEMLWEDWVRRVEEPRLEYLAKGHELGVVIAQRIADLKKRPPDDPNIPKSPADMYNQLVLYGGKSDWTDLTDEQQQPYRLAFDLMIREIDAANDEYEDKTLIIEAEYQKLEADLARIAADTKRIDAVRRKRIHAAIRQYNAFAEDTLLGRRQTPF